MELGKKWKNWLKNIFEKQKPGYRDGVVLVPVPADRFYKVGPYQIGKDYISRLEARQEGEKPVMVTVNDDEKIQCNFVDIVLYRKDVLAEDGDDSADADWEIVSVNGKEEDIEEPIPPTAMARNFLHMKGGTKANYTAEEFAKAIMYWSNRG